MIRCESVAPVSWTLAAQVLVAALCFGALIDKPSHAGRSCRILGRPERLHLNAFSAAHFVQMLLFANTRALCGPQLEGRADRARAQQRAQRC